MCEIHVKHLSAQTKIQYILLIISVMQSSEPFNRTKMTACLLVLFPQFFHFTITSLTIHNAINQPNIISYISWHSFVQTSNEIHRCVTRHFVDLYFFVALPTVKTFKTVNLYKMPCYFCFQTIEKLLWLGISNGRSLKTSLQTNIAIKSQKLPSQKKK